MSARPTRVRYVMLGWFCGLSMITYIDRVSIMYLSGDMRRDLGMTDTYIVALSGYGTEEDRRKSFHAGFDTHLVKPLDPSALPGILASAERRPA